MVMGTGFDESGRRPLLHFADRSGRVNEILVWLARRGQVRVMRSADLLYRVTTRGVNFALKGGEAQIVAAFLAHPRVDLVHHLFDATTILLLLQVKSLDVVGGVCLLVSFLVNKVSTIRLHRLICLQRCRVIFYIVDKHRRFSL